MAESTPACNRVSTFRHVDDRSMTTQASRSLLGLAEECPDAATPGDVHQCRREHSPSHRRRSLGNRQQRSAGLWRVPVAKVLQCRGCVRSGDGRHRRSAAGSGGRAGTCARRAIDQTPRGAGVRCGIGEAHDPVGDVVDRPAARGDVADAGVHVGACHRCLHVQADPYRADYLEIGGLGIAGEGENIRSGFEAAVVGGGGGQADPASTFDGRG